MSEETESSVRAEVRAWLEANWKPDYGLVEWRTKLIESGWGAPHWPKQWYGRDLPVKFTAIVDEEFARIGAVRNLNVEDYRQEGKEAVLELREKGGKRKTMVVHHLLEKYLDDYIAAAGIAEEKGTPLFRSADGKTGKLRANRMSQAA